MFWFTLGIVQNDINQILHFRMNIGCTKFDRHVLIVRICHWNMFDSFQNINPYGATQICQFEWWFLSPQKTTVSHFSCLHAQVECMLVQYCHKYITHALVPITCTAVFLNGLMHAIALVEYWEVCWVKKDYILLHYSPLSVLHRQHKDTYTGMHIFFQSLKTNFIIFQSYLIASNSQIGCFVKSSLV